VRVRPLPLIAAIFVAAAAATAFVVAQFPREGELSAPPPRVDAAPAAGETPPLDAPATAADASIDLRVTAGGEPQAEAEVRLYLADGRGGWRRAAEGRSGADGAARLFARTGAYLVAVRAPGLAPAHAEVIRAGGEEVTHAEVALEPAAALHGHVSARQGGALARARVRALPVVTRWPGFAPPSVPPEEVAVATADAAGAFHVDGIAPGTYAVEIDAPGYHPALLPRVAVPCDALAIALEPLGRLEGIVLRADGRPAAGAVVRAASAEHGATATAGAEGAFALSAPAGSYRVNAALGDAAGGAADPVALAAGGTARGLEIRLGPGAVLEGEVVLASGRAAAGGEVAVFPHETREVAARTVADGAGRFRIAGLAAGAWDVRATAPGASPATAAGVTLSAGARFPLRLALAGTGSAEGTVRDVDGRPMAGVHVRVVQRGDGLPGAPWLEARSGFDGDWRIDGLEVGRADLVARQLGVALGEARSVRVDAGRASTVDFFLAEAGLLVGRVGRGGEPPPAGTTVVATPMKAGLGTLQVARAAADATGNYRLALPAGEYRVHGAPAGAARADPRARPAFARVEPGRTTRLDLPPASAAEQGVEILVLEPGGAPSPGAVVTLARADDEKVAFASTAGDDGRVVLGREMGVAGRRVLVRARNGGRTAALAVELPASGTVPVTLEPGGAVRGLVRARGAAVGGFTVEVASQPAQASWRTVDVHRFAGDRFELGDLPAEPLRLVVRADDGRRGAAEVSVAAGEVRAVEIALER
jgi:hypothetical protein